MQIIGFASWPSLSSHSPTESACADRFPPYIRSRSPGFFDRTSLLTHTTMVQPTRFAGARCGVNRGLTVPDGDSRTLKGPVDPIGTCPTAWDLHDIPSFFCRAGSP
jgi:hypothetical protein